MEEKERWLDRAGPPATDCSAITEMGLAHERIFLSETVLAITRAILSPFPIGAPFI